MIEVKREFVLEVGIHGEPSVQTLLDAVSRLREEAEKEFGLGFTERVDIIGTHRYSNPPYDKNQDFPTIIFRAYPPK